LKKEALKKDKPRQKQEQNTVQKPLVYYKNDGKEKK
jgi:hypothetical protein